MVPSLLRAIRALDEMGDRMMPCAPIPEKIMESTGHYPVFYTCSDECFILVPSEEGGMFQEPFLLF